MPDYKINIIVEGHDKASAPLGNVRSALANMGTVAGGIIGAQVFTHIATGIMDMGRAALGSYADYERLGMSLQSLTAKEILSAGGAEDMTAALAAATPKAAELQGWIQRLAIESPFDQAGVADAFRMAMAYGFTTDEAKRLTTATIDFTSATGASSAAMQRIALALGQIKAKGKVAGQEVLQLTEAGLSVDKILAEAFGKTTAEIVAMREKGLIPADEAIKAITESLEKDFGGAAKRQATTFSGLMSSLEDIKTVGLREFFTGTFEAIQPLLIEFVDYMGSPGTMKNIREFGENIGRSVGSVVNSVRSFVNSDFGRAIGGLAENLGRLGRYFSGVASDGDYLNKWLKRLPLDWQPTARFVGELANGFMAFGRYIVETAQSGDYLNNWIASLPDAWEPTAIVVGNLVDTFRDLWGIVKDGIQEGDIQAILDRFGVLGAGIDTWAAGIDFRGILDNFKARLSDALADFTTWGSSEEVLAAARMAGENIGKSVGTSFKTLFQTMLGEAAMFFKDGGFEGLLDVANTASRIATTFTSNLLTGLIEGITGIDLSPQFKRMIEASLRSAFDSINIWSWVSDWFSSFGGEKGADAVKNFLKGQLPSGGGRGAGGPVLANTAYPVGEHGVEVFVPNANGTIIPNHQLGGTVVINLGGITINGAARGDDVRAGAYAGVMDAARSMGLRLA